MFLDTDGCHVPFVAENAEFTYVFKKSFPCILLIYFMCFVLEMQAVFIRYCRL